MMVLLESRSLVTSITFVYKFLLENYGKLCYIIDWPSKGKLSCSFFIFDYVWSFSSHELVDTLVQEVLEGNSTR